MDEQATLDLVLTLAARLCREAPFDGGGADLCSRLALLGGARGLALFSLAGDEPQAALLGAYGLPVDYPRRFPPRERRPVGHLPGDLRDALRRGEPVLVEGIADDARTASLTSVALQGRFTSTWSIPLLVEGTAVGLVHAFYVPEADDHRRSLLARAAPMVATALAADRLRATVARLQEGSIAAAGAQLYPVTPMHRQLAHVHAAAERYGQGYSVVVYSLDHAARVVDRFGPELLQAAVTGLGELLAAECRGSDFAGRLTSTEVMSALPWTSDRGAFAQAERVLQRFARTAFRHADARLTFTASAGISAFPVNGALDGRSSLQSARSALDVARLAEGDRTIAIAAASSAAPGVG